MIQNDFVKYLEEEEISIFEIQNLKNTLDLVRKSKKNRIFVIKEK